MRTEPLLRHAVRGAVALGSAGSLTGAAAALAQKAPAPGTVIQLSEIIVTGTHIPRTSIAKAQPVITITRRQIDATGFTTVGQLLQNMTAAGISLNAKSNVGAETITLHDLGLRSVLVLVNGQRWIPTLFGPVDLSTIPLAIVQRVEVLLDGASAVYGSDAIGGVVNIITVKNFDGAEADAYYGAYDAHGDGGGWDGKTQQYNFTVGTEGRRSSVLLSAGYNQQLPVWAGNRTISKEPVIGFGVQNGSDGSLGGRFVVLNGPGGQLVDGCQPSYCDISGPDPFDSTGYHAWTEADRYNFQRANYLQYPSERWHIYSQGHYDLTDNLSFNFMTTYQRRNAMGVFAPSPWFFGLYGSETQNGMPIGMAKNAPDNPFGVDLVPYYSSSPGFTAWCAHYGSPNCTQNFDILLYYGRRAVETGNRVESLNNQTFYFNGGFNGYFDLASNEWRWNTNYIYSQTLASDVTQGLSNTARIQQALSYGCASDPNCVPLNVFGGAGSITPAMADYVTYTGHSVTQQVMRDYNANVAGGFLNGWYAGPWGAAAGYEYEELDGFDQPDSTAVAGDSTGNPSQPTNGRENTNAQYVEFNIPLANNAPLARDMSVDLAERWSQFRWGGIGNVYDPATEQVTTEPAGNRAHSATPRATLMWKPVDSLLLRGTWSQSFRTPSISELFFGTSIAYEFASDPCAKPAPQPIPPGCPERHSQPNAQIPTIVGGNVALEPEKAVTRTAGFVYSPPFAPGLDFAADYFKTEFTNRIGAYNAQFYLDECYVNQNAQSCQHLVVVGPVVTRVISLNDNIGFSQKVEGWDVNARYQLPVTPAGTFTLRLAMDFMQKDVYCFAGSCSDVGGSILSGQPMHRYNFSVDWNYGPWAATWGMRVIGPMWEPCIYSLANGEGPTPGAPPVFGWCSKIIDYYDANGNKTTNPADAVAIADGQNHLGTTVYNDIQASYTVTTWNTTFTVGANNVFDKQPPINMTSVPSFLPYYYDIPGRFFYGRISVAF